MGPAQRRDKMPDRARNVPGGNAGTARNDRIGVTKGREFPPELVSISPLLASDPASCRSGAQPTAVAVRSNHDPHLPWRLGVMPARCYLADSAKPSKTP